MKPINRKNYGSIPHFSFSNLSEGDKYINVGQERLATEKVRDKHDTVIVQEKLDGSNVGVAKLNQQLIPITRGGNRAESSNYLQHQYFAKWLYQPENFQRFYDLLEEGERACGEWLLQAHGTFYNLPHEPFVLFDIFTPENKRLNYQRFKKGAADFVIPRELHYGNAPFSKEEAEKATIVSGHGAIGVPEGCVYRFERKGVVQFLAKYVRPEKTIGCYMEEEIGISGALPLEETYRILTN